MYIMSATPEKGQRLQPDSHSAVVMLTRHFPVELRLGFGDDAPRLVEVLSEGAFRLGQLAASVFEITRLEAQVVEAELMAGLVVAMPPKTRINREPVIRQQPPA